MSNAQCDAPDCGNPPRSRTAKYCEKHYYRLRRTGSLDVSQVQIRRGPTCGYPDCGKPHASLGFCSMHLGRLRRNGDPSVAIPVKDRNIPRGSAHPDWTGDSATYSTVHQRLRKQRGPASGHACAKCGGPARQWSYDHSDPAEKTSEFGAYSTDLDHYAPLCVPCHKTSDLAVMAATGRRLGAPIDLDAIRRMHADGIRVLRMSKLLGVGRKRIDRALDELGLPRFPPGGPPQGIRREAEDGGYILPAETTEPGMHPVAVATADGGLTAWPTCGGAWIFEAPAEAAS